jgi:thiol-disulfide isomerase/thioredoxin
MHLTNSESINQLNKLVKDKEDAHIFLLIFMEGCGPCDQAKIEWAKIENIAGSKSYKNVRVLKINKDTLSEVTSLPTLDSQVEGYPTILYINARETEEPIVEKYLNPRTVDEFNNWINEKAPQKMGGKRSYRTRVNRKHSNKKTKKSYRTTKLRAKKSYKPTKLRAKKSYKPTKLSGKKSYRTTKLRAKKSYKMATLKRRNFA